MKKGLDSLEILILKRLTEKWRKDAVENERIKTSNPGNRLFEVKADCYKAQLLECAEDLERILNSWRSSNDTATDQTKRFL